MIELEEARALVLANCPGGQVESVALRDARGLVIAATVHATEAMPPFDRSLMDGYAVRSADVAATPVRLGVVGAIRAGQAGGPPVGSGEAVRIMTGAPIPAGADAVVMVEETETEGEIVVVRTPVAHGENVRHAGDDVRAGDVVLEAGTVLRAAHLGALAQLGIAAVAAHRRLRVGFIATGDELVGDGSPLKAGQIRPASQELLFALLSDEDCIPIDLGIVPDDEEAITEAFVAGGESCDALITTGGVSMGDYDLVRVVLDKLGRMHWMQIAIRPGKPFALGLLGDDPHATPVFGLPGDPISSFVSFELLVRPALRKMMGHTRIEQPLVAGVVDSPLRRRPGDGVVHWRRVIAELGDDGRLHVASPGPEDARHLAGSASANGLARLPDGPGVEPGDDVMVMLLD